jgi:sigma-B regulation protein RsbU (phosphoserine phosphatase)
MDQASAKLRVSPLSAATDPDDENARLAAVRRYDILDTPPDGAFDRVANLAARLFQVPIATVTIVDEDRVWFKAAHGLTGVSQIGRDPGLCASVILRDDAYVIADALTDPRALNHPLVLGEFGLRFYAAAPIVTGDGHRLGTVNVIDREPREVTRDQAAALTDLAAIVMDQLELRLSAMRVVELERRQRQQVEVQKARIERTVRQLKQAMTATGDAPAACQLRRGGSHPCTGPVEVKVVDLTPFKGRHRRSLTRHPGAPGPPPEGGTLVAVEPEQSADLVVELIATRPSRPLLLALDGPSAAGTSTLAAVLAARLGTGVVHGDDFYRDMPEEQRWKLTAEQGVEQYFDWQRLRRQALEPLRNGESTSYRPFSWRPEGGLATHRVTVAPTPVVVVEGVYAARPELQDLIDLAVFVDTPAELRQRRLIARGHGNDAWWPRWDAAEELYFTTIRPIDSFDLVVPGY